jgi:GT2 family glycosyltransferase
VKNTVQSSNPLVSVVIVNYNGRNVLEHCLQSLFSQPFQPIEVIVVDNCSTDGSAEIVSQRYPDVRLIGNSANLGFAHGCNQGVREAGGTFCVLLNSDVVIDANWLPPLLATVTRSGVGAVCSKVETEGVPPEYYSKNGTVNYLGYNIMGEFDDLSQVFYATGASVIFRRDISDSPFIDKYFLYQEDLYFSWKLRLRGFQILMAQESLVHHRGSEATRHQPSSLVTFYQERNRLLNSFLLYETKTLILLLPLFIADALAKTLSSLAGEGKSFAGIVRAYWWIATHPAWIRTERARHQALRTVQDAAIMRLMSYKVLNGDTVTARVLNRVSLAYARLVGLPFHE